VERDVRVVAVALGKDGPARAGGCGREETGHALGFFELKRNFELFHRKADASICGLFRHSGLACFGCA
jgi:hypothetical protein